MTEIVAPTYLHDPLLINELMVRLSGGTHLEFLRKRDLHQFLIYAEVLGEAPIVMANHFKLKYEQGRLVTY